MTCPQLWLNNLFQEKT